MKQIYFDHNSTTPLDPRVLEAMLPYLRDTYGNASSVHSVGQAARAGLEQSREKLASLLGCRPDELYFTSGATESNNIAIKGVAEALAHKGRHIITTRTEHQAVLEPCKYLEKHDYEVTYLEVDSRGYVDTEQLRSSIRPDTILVSIIMANNETGTLQDVAGAGKHRPRTKCVFPHRRRPGPWQDAGQTCMRWESIWLLELPTSSMVRKALVFYTQKSVLAFCRTRMAAPTNAGNAAVLKTSLERSVWRLHSNTASTSSKV